MSRISDIGNKDISELKQVVRDMALRINQLERMLNNQDLYEVMVQDGVLYQRKVRLSLNNGLTRDSFVPVSVIGDDDGTGGMDYDYLFVGAGKVTPPEKTTNFLKVNLDGSGSSWVAAMPETQDEDAVVFDVTKNRIYIHGAFGGA